MNGVKMQACYPVKATLLWSCLALGGIFSARVDAQWSAHPPDHLKHLEGDTSVNARIEVELGKAGLWTVSNKAMPHLRKADSLFRTKTDTIGDHWFLWYRADHLYRMGYQLKFRRDIPGALKHFQLSGILDEERGDSMVAGIKRDALGVLLMAIGEHRLAEVEFRTALAFTAARLEAPHEYLAYQGGHLVRCLAAQGRKGEAWQLWDSLYAHPGHIPGTTGLLLEHRAHLHRLGSNLEAALTDLRTADSLYRFAPYVWARLSSLTGLSKIAAELHDHQGSLLAAEECVLLADTLGDEAAGCGCRVLAAQAHAALGHEHRVERELQVALSIAEANGYMGLARELGDEGSMVNIAGLLKDLYIKQGRTADALRMTTLWASLKDTLHAMQGREDVLRFDLRRKVLADSLSKDEAAALARLEFEQELARESDKGYMRGLIGLVTTLFLGILTFGFAQRNKQQKQFAAVEMQRLVQEQVIAEFRIRDQLGRDMHDDLGGGLSALRMRSELALRSETDTTKRLQLEAMARQSVELIDNMRQLLWALHSEDSDLRSTITHCCDHARGYLADQDITFRCKVDDHIPALELMPQQRRNIYLLVKEALHNTVKHAGAGVVELEARWRAGALHMRIHDDGRGMAPSAKDHQSRGLINMADRMKELGGTFTWYNEGGLTIDVVIPLGKAPAAPRKGEHLGHAV